MRIIRIALVTALLVTSTAIAHPGSGIVVDRRGYVYFLDTGIGVWVVDPSGKLARHDGPRFHWMAIDESEQPFGARLPAIPGGEVSPAGVNPTLLLSSDVPVVIGRDGALYYSEFGHDERLRIMRFTRSGVRTVRAIIPLLRWVNGLAAGPDGSLYYTEDKAVFVAASGCGAVLEITPRGEISTVLRSVPPWSPTAVAVSPSGLYVLEYLTTATEDRQAWVPRVRKLLPNGSVVGIAVIERPKIGR